MGPILSTKDNNDEYVLNLWKAFCRSRQALSMEYDSPDTVINKWDNRFKINTIDQVQRYVKENITIEGHVLDDPF